MPLIEPGRKAPDFRLLDQNGKTRTLRDFGGRLLVLYFYPKDESALCTAQACQFRDAFGDFSKIKATIVGVSPDDGGSHAAFARHHNLAFPLLSDPRDDEGTAPTCDAYGTWAGKIVFGRDGAGVVRTTYLIAPDRVVIRRWDNVKVPGHGAEVLAAARGFHSGVVAEPKPVRRRERGPAQPRNKAPRSTTKRTRTHDSDPPFTPIRGSQVSRSSTKPGGVRTRGSEAARGRAMRRIGRGGGRG